MTSLGICCGKPQTVSPPSSAETSPVKKVPSHPLPVAPHLRRKTFYHSDKPVTLERGMTIQISSSKMPVKIDEFRRNSTAIFRTAKMPEYEVCSVPKDETLATCPTLVEITEKVSWGQVCPNSATSSDSFKSARWIIDSDDEDVLTPEEIAKIKRGGE